MADPKDPAVKTKIKTEDISVAPIKPDYDIQDIIAKTVAATYEALAPALEKAYKHEAPQPKPDSGSLRTQDSSIRTRIISEMNREFDSVINANKKFLARMANLKKEDMVQITIPRVYAPHIGSVCKVALNGSMMEIPVDNRPHWIPRFMKPFVDQMLAYEDEKIAYMQQNNGADIRETADIKSI